MTEGGKRGSDGMVLSIVPRLPTMADDDGAPPPLVNQRTNLCCHWVHTAAVDIGSRSVVCSECGAELDPYDVLVRLARDGTKLVEARKRLRALTKRIEELRAEERRVKARVKRWRGQVGGGSGGSR